MNISVTYSGRTYYISSFNYSEEKYTLTISESKAWKNNISIKFNIDSKHEVYPQNGEVVLPKQKAIQMAIAILNFCQLSENTSEPLPSVLNFDDKDFRSKFESKITVQELAEVLQIEEELIFQEAEKINLHGVLLSDTHITLKHALAIRDSLKKDEIERL